VLKRIANHLFWAARYWERAEWRARLVDVNYHLLVESPPGPQQEWAGLLAITGDREDFFQRYENADEPTVLNFYTFDQLNPSSIQNCIGRARENCRALRNHISSEMWFEVNTLYLDFKAWKLEALYAQGVYGFFAELRERFYRLAGAIENTSPRDSGYEFLTAGRMLEAAENISRLLDVKYHFLLPRVEDVGSALDLSQWTALLRSASALEAYRKAHGNAITIQNVVQFLLFDRHFSRAARFSIDRLVAALEQIAVAADDQPMERVPTPRALQAKLHQGSAAAVIAAGLHEYLLAIQDDCARIGDEVLTNYLKFE
jgi:uncharacterized alpha-E superfamily protein